MPYCLIMRIEAEDERALIADVATRAGTAKEIAKWYGVTIAELKQWVAEHRTELEAYREGLLDRPESEPEPSAELDPTQLADLWITNKFERLRRLQLLAELQYKQCESGKLVGAELATGLREFRSYLALAANELGQLLHRGSGESADGETLEVEIKGVDMNALR
jgi:hypothetical protein